MRRSPVRTLLGVAVLGMVGVAIGLALLLLPIGYGPGQSCGSVVHRALPAGVPGAAADCAHLAAGQADGALLFGTVGVVVALGGAGGALLHRRRAGVVAA